MPLPPLRTVRDVGASDDATPPPAQRTPAARQHLHSAAGANPLPPALRNLLNDAFQADLIDAPDCDAFLAKLGPRLRDIHHQELAAAACIHHGLLTPFQAERLLAGNAFGLAIGNYRVLERISGGTVGIVFRGCHKILRRPVAIKVVPDDDATPPQFVERFDLEMELLARVDHPNVVRIYDTGVLPSPGPGTAALRYAILEYADSGDLEQYVYQHGVLPLETAAHHARQLAAGLAAMHAHNLVHRDFKPSNVLLTKTGRTMVSDFGLARHFASTATPRPGVVGSVQFMAPEQTTDATTVGPAADVYALAATLFWTLTGQLPFANSASTKEALEAIRTGKPRRLRDLNPEMPESLDDMLSRMMSRDPARRPTALESCGWFGAFAQAAAGSADTPAGEAELLRFAVSHLEAAVAVREEMANEASAAVLTALARTLQVRGETAGQQSRMQKYVRAMAEKLKRKPDWLMLADPLFLDDLARAAAIRNIGLAGVPDNLLNPGMVLSAAESATLERHTLIGCKLFDAVISRHGKALPHARIVHDIIRSHHERWDGSGYPDRLSKDQIPPAARLVAVAEAYDLLRQPKNGQPGMLHDAAIQHMVETARGLFDPTVIDAMLASHDTFAAIFSTIPD